MTEINCILGTGMTAKIFAFYNREYKIIGKNKSLITDPVLKNLIFLQDNSYNRMFLQDLMNANKNNINYYFKKIDVLVAHKDGYSDIITEEEKSKLINKKLTSVDGKKLEYKNSLFESNLKLAEEKNSVLKTIEVDFEDITKGLEKIVANQIIDETNILNIDLERKLIVTEKATYNYKDCVNTLSLNKFSKLTNKDFGNLDTLDTTIIEGTEEIFGVLKIPYTDAIVYYPQNEFEFSKIVKRNNKCYAEITGQTIKFADEKFVKSFSKDARLIKKNIINNYNGLIFLGRYAQWDPDCRIQDIVRRSSDKIAMQNIWSDQKAFSNKFFNMEPDLKLVQNNIKECSMLMMQEIFDLLNNINWKIHGQEKKLDIERIKEEWIDIYKYWLTIGINLGLSYEDFLDAYEKKGIKLKEKYERR